MFADSEVCLSVGAGFGPPVTFPKKCSLPPAAIVVLRLIRNSAVFERRLDGKGSIFCPPRPPPPLCRLSVHMLRLSMPSLTGSLGPTMLNMPGSCTKFTCVSSCRANCSASTPTSKCRCTSTSEQLWPPCGWKLQGSKACPKRHESHRRFIFMLRNYLDSRAENAFPSDCHGLHQ